MTKPRGMDEAYYRFIYVPVVAVIGIYIISILIESFIPNDIFRYIIVTGGVLGVIIIYYKEQIKKFI